MLFLRGTGQAGPRRRRQILSVPAAAEPLRAAGPGGLRPAPPAATGARPVPSGPVWSRPVPASAGGQGLAHSGICFSPVPVTAVPPLAPGRPSRTLQAWSGYMHLVCWDHPGSERLRLIVYVLLNRSGGYRAKISRNFVWLAARIRIPPPFHPPPGLSSSPSQVLVQRWV